MYHISFYVPADTSVGELQEALEGIGVTGLSIKKGAFPNGTAIRFPEEYNIELLNSVKEKLAEKETTMTSVFPKKGEMLIVWNNHAFWTSFPEENGLVINAEEL